MAAAATAGRVVLAFALLILAACTSAPAPVAAHGIELSADRVPLNTEDRSQTTVGALDYLAGLVLDSSDPRFGGLSGLEISQDGVHMIAVSDRGTWFTGRLVHDGDGVLMGVADAAIRPILDTEGQAVDGAWRDAEEVSRLADGTLLVSFERRHRIWAYDGSAALSSARSRGFFTPTGFANAPANGGIEAMTQLADGRLLAVTEKVFDGATQVRGWLISADGKHADRISYTVAQSFAPTAFATLDNGDVLALERRFNAFIGAGARLMRIARADIVPGATLAGREIARLQAPLTVDNFEGLALSRGPAGETFVYLVSDNNFKTLQRTLLLQFRLRE